MKRPFLESPSTALVSLALLLTLLLLSAGTAFAAANDTFQDPTPVRDVPPEITDGFLQLIDPPTKTANARLFVVFAHQKTTLDAQTFDLGDQVIKVFDDGKGADDKAGDRVFTGAFQLDLDQLEEMNATVDAKSQFGGFQPKFSKRALVEEEPIEPLDLVSLKKGLRVRIFPRAISMPATVDPASSLMITDLGVVDDPVRTFNPCTGVGNPNGAWTFGHLMTEMANQAATGINPSALTREWLAEWETLQTINSDPVPPRAAAIQNLVINPWEMASGGPGAPLDLTKAPMQLLAIVNRVDLRSNPTYGGGGASAGEGRFVFGVMDSNCNPTRFSVIFEYGIPKRTCEDIKDWGQQWKDLDQFVLGSPAYNAALQAITDQFTAANADPSKLPNRSALNQLRTNEIALGNPWELREFRLDDPSAPGFLTQVTVKQTPDSVLNGSPTLANYINQNEAVILANKHEVPEEFPLGSGFLGGHAPTPFNDFWQAPGINNNNARHEFSLDTCDGCHARETNTQFVHVEPNTPNGQQAALSGFLTGINVNDPFLAQQNPPVILTRTFNDLLRRQNDLDALTSQTCLFQVFHRPMLDVH